MTMKNLFLDCEFNGFGGELLSMGIVDDENRIFYEILHYDNINYDPWVRYNVLPIMNPDHSKIYREPIPYKLFQQKLQDYLGFYTEGFNLVVDWPDDIKYFCQSIILGPGIMMSIPEFTSIMTRKIGTSGANPQHNALSDAIAIRNNYNRVYK